MNVEAGAGNQRSGRTVTVTVTHFRELIMWITTFARRVLRKAAALAAVLEHVNTAIATGPFEAGP